jgi:acetyltransferase
VASLDAFFRPKRVAVVGASYTPGKWGYLVLRTLADGGYAGEVAAVNGRGGEVQGRPAFATVADLPWAPDLALVVVGREGAVGAVEALAARGCRHAIVHAAGFAETGAAGAALEARLLAAARAGGMRLLGPNCMNLMVAESRLNLTGIPDLRPGRLAFISQSGNLVYDLVEHGRASGLGLSLFVSVGNQADLGVEDCLDWLAEDPGTAAVALYIEALRRGAGPRFLVAARRLAARKPVLALLGGRTEPGRRAARSHTASLLGNVRLLRGLLRQAGVIEVARLDELFPTAAAVIASPPAAAPTAALCGGGGGHGTIGCDALAAHGISVPPLTPATQAALAAILPPIASVRNPIDWVGASERSFWAYRDTARLLLADPGIGGVILFGHFGGYRTERETPADNYRDVAVALGELQRSARKPLFVHSIYARQSRAAFDTLRGAGVPLFDSLETAAAAFRALVEHGRNLKRGPLPAARPRDDLLAPYAERARAEGRTALLEPEARAWLAALGAPVAPGRFARTGEEAVAFAAEAGRPVALKLVSAAILHKAAVGGVRLGLEGAAAVGQAFAALGATARERGADFRGALVVPMADAGVEVAVGAARAELGGHALLFAAGGSAIEDLDDATARPAPIDAADAAEMVAETRIGRLLLRAPAAPDLAPLHALMVTLSEAVAGSALVEAVDLNPVRLGPGGVTILDARVVLGPPAPDA